MIIDGVKLKGRSIEVLDTYRGQKLRAKDHVAYVLLVELETIDNYGEVTVRVHGGTIKVATIVVIEETCPAWAEGDGSYDLHLDNGDVVSAHDAVRTDGYCR